MSDKNNTPPSFFMTAIKKNGEERKLESQNINDCIKALWVVRDVQEGYVTYTVNGEKTYRLLAKVGRKRAANSALYRGGKPIEGRPNLKIKNSAGWQRLPSKFNEIK